jgi:hypothetical protein
MTMTITLFVAAKYNNMSSLAYGATRMGAKDKILLNSRKEKSASSFHCPISPRSYKEALPSH